MDLVFLCDPANPSGRNIDESILAMILDTAADCKAAVILDESFYHMSSRILRYPVDRSRELLSKYDNLYIIRSMTKLLAVPGIRAGYVLSSPANMERLKRQLPEWNLSVTAESVVTEGIRAMKETDLLQRTGDIIGKERDYLSSKLKQLGFRVCRSDTSFILFKGPEKLYEALLEQGILIRDCSDMAGLCRGWYRVSARIHSDNEYLIQTMRGIMDEL
jgi:threonine-phosphate decarboxylase